MRRLARRLAELFRPSRSERELAREMAAHLALLEDEYRRRGMSAEDARYAARRAMGGVDQAKELQRDARSFPWLEDARRDVVYAVRSLVRVPAFTTVAILTVALGIGATSAIFSVVSGVLLTPLPYPNPDGLVRIVEHVPADESFSGNAARMPAIYAAEFEWWRTRATTLATMAVTVPQPHTLRTPSGNHRLAGARVSPALFEMYGLTPMFGRGLRLDEERPDAGVVVLSADVWRQHFAGDPGIVSRTVFLDDQPFTVVGVMPREFGEEDFWIPFVPEDARPGQVSVIPAIARLRDGVSLEAASAEVNRVGLELRGAEPSPGGAPRFELARVQDEVVRRVQPAIRVLMAAVAVVLLIVCANVANLLLTRGARRQQELDIRRAIGATTGRLLRQAVTESLVLAIGGGVAGVAVAYGFVAVLKTLAVIELPAGFGQALGSTLLPRIDQIAVDGRVLMFTGLIALVSGLCFGIVPALRFAAPRQPLMTTAIASGAGLGRTLAGLQLVLATTLLIGAGLLMHSFVKLAAVDLGFDPSGVLTFDLVLPEHYVAERKLQIAEQVADRLGAMPGVSAAGFTDGPPLSNRTARPYGAYAPPLRTGDRRDPEDAIDQRLVSPGYLRALRVRLLSGRWLEPEDRAVQPPAILINRAYVRYYFGERNAVGAVLPTRAGPAVVAGVVDDVRFDGVDREPRLAGYVDPRPPLELNARNLAARGRQRSAEGNRLFLSGFTGGIAYAVRVNGDPLAIADDVQRIVREIDGSAALDAIMPMEQVIAGTIAQPRFYAFLVGVFAAIAAVLAAVGIYGVLAYGVAQRTREFGIRLALGGERRDVLALVMRQGGTLVAAGITLGVAGAFAVTRYLEGMLFGLTPLDAPTYAVVAGAFAVVALLAAYVPARRATRVNPLAALRYE
jgi:predicted permease